MAKRSKPAETLRHAVDQTFQAAAGGAQTTRDRAQELVDELAHTAGRLRGALDDLRPAGGEDLRALRADLEQRAAASPGGARRTSPRRARTGGA